MTVGILLVGMLIAAIVTVVAYMLLGLGLAWAFLSGIAGGVVAALIIVAVLLSREMNEDDDTAASGNPVEDH